MLLRCTTLRSTNLTKHDIHGLTGSVNEMSSASRKDVNDQWYEVACNAIVNLQFYDEPFARAILQKQYVAALHRLRRIIESVEGDTAEVPDFQKHIGLMASKLRDSYRELKNGPAGARTAA